MITKFIQYTTTVTEWLTELLPLDIVVWLGALLTAMLILAGWRILKG